MPFVTGENVFYECQYKTALCASDLSFTWFAINVIASSTTSKTAAKTRDAVSQSQENTHGTASQLAGRMKFLLEEEIKQ